MLARTMQEWVALMEAANVPCGPIYNMQQMFEDPHVQHRGMRLSLPHSAGVQAPAVASPIRLSDTPIQYGRSAPLLGEAHRQCAGPAVTWRRRALPNCGRGARSEPARHRRDPAVFPCFTKEKGDSMLRHTFIRAGPGGRVSGLRRGRARPGQTLVDPAGGPYPAGGAADQIARLVANDAGAILGTPIVIENKGRRGRNDRRRIRPAGGAGRRDLSRGLQRTHRHQSGHL